MAQITPKNPSDLACGNPVENPVENLGKTRRQTGLVSPPMPPPSRKDYFLIAREATAETRLLVDALIDANTLLKAELDALRATLIAKGYLP